MYVLTYKKKSGQLELSKGFEIKEFSISTSSVVVVFLDGKKDRLPFSEGRAISIYSSMGTEPIIKLGGGN
jgi:hypothetical protein